ncbi:zonular occludens toxin domain-containing protein [Dyella subtropica]|uniref:zonular occludens toxin domain-containing protein n=1 Tax=Dyella subtropica TaxID=2992127 RepID=UPI00224EE09A|nr:zonular occludens toxin domain-containing protein [Dyella subtropica]
MRFELRSGLRGAGKTLGVVEELLARSKDANDVRPRYQLYIKDLRPDLAEAITVEQLMDWKSFPPGSTIYVDEAHRFIPVRTGSSSLPAWIRDLSESRHLAIDFVWITQDPSMIDVHVRKLIDRHVHTVRKFRSTMVERYEWPEYQEKPTSKGSVRSVESKTRHIYSKEAQACYTSAVMHTAEARVPSYVKKGALVLLAVPALLYGGYVYVKHRAEPAAPSAQASDKADAGKGVGMSLGGARSDGKADAKAPMSPDEWVRRQIPRVAGIPWSAPIFDEQKVVSKPDLLCVSYLDDNGAERCLCHTEQGTRAEVPHSMCLQFSKGGVYNPFKEPLSSQNQAVASRDRPEPAVEAQKPVADSGGGPGGRVRDRVTSKPYTPPTYGEWNPDPFGASRHN